jgi:hypothetical protein
LAEKEAEVQRLEKELAAEQNAGPADPPAPPPPSDGATSA